MSYPSWNQHSDDEYGTVEPYDNSGLNLAYISLPDQLADAHPDSASLPTSDSMTGITGTFSSIKIPTSPVLQHVFGIPFGAAPYNGVIDPVLLADDEHQGSPQNVPQAFRNYMIPDSETIDPAGIRSLDNPWYSQPWIQYPGGETLQDNQEDEEGITSSSPAISGTMGNSDPSQYARDPRVSSPQFNLFTGQRAALIYHEAGNSDDDPFTESSCGGPPDNDTLDPDSNKENIPNINRPRERLEMLKLIANSSKYEFFEMFQAEDVYQAEHVYIVREEEVLAQGEDAHLHDDDEVYVLRNDEFQGHIAFTKKAVAKYQENPKIANVPYHMLQPIEYDSDAETIRGDSMTPPPRGREEILNRSPVKKIRRTVNVKQSRRHAPEQIAESSRKRARLDVEPQAEEIKKPVAKRKRKIGARLGAKSRAEEAKDPVIKKQMRVKSTSGHHSDVDSDATSDATLSGDQDSEDDFKPTKSRLKAAVKKETRVKPTSGHHSDVDSDAPLAADHHSEDDSGFTPAKSPCVGKTVITPKAVKYTPRTDFTRGARPTFLNKGTTYSDEELQRVKYEYETYHAAHPDTKTRLHSEHLGAYISDVLYDKYGINRTGIAIKLCFQRWIRGVLTSIDDRTDAHRDSNNLRTSLQVSSSKKAAANAAAAATAFTVSSPALPSSLLSSAGQMSSNDRGTSGHRALAYRKKAKGSYGLSASASSDL